MRLFVSGTDTGVGKTYATAAILRALRERGRSCAGFKPIESGAPTPGQPGEDALLLARAAQTEPLFRYSYAAAVSPHLASRGGPPISSKNISDALDDHGERYVDVLVEGAGGLLVPVNDHETIADLAVHLQLPLLLVAADRLGGINHTLLSLDVARQRGLSVAAVVLNQVDAGETQELGNGDAIERFGRVPVFPLPHGASHAPSELVDHLLRL